MLESDCRDKDSRLDSVAILGTAGLQVPPRAENISGDHDLYNFYFLILGTGPPLAIISVGPGTRDPWIPLKTLLA